MCPEGFTSAFAAKLSQCSAIFPSASNLKISNATCSPVPAKLYTVCKNTLSPSSNARILLTVVFTGADARY